MESKTHTSELLQNSKLKQSFCTLVSAEENQTFFLNDTESIHRYYKGLRAALKHYPNKDVNAFLVELVNLYQDTDIALLKLNDTVNLYHAWTSNQNILQLLNFFYLKIKSTLRFDVDFTSYILKYTFISKKEKNSCEAKLYLLVKLINQKHITIENWVNHVSLIRLIFDRDYSVYLKGKSTLDIEKIVSNHFHVLLFWFKNFKKHKLPFETYSLVYANYYTWTSLKWMDLEDKMPLYKILQDKVPVDYMVNCCNSDFAKWQELYQWKPSLFENMLQQTTVPENGFELLLSLFENYTFSGAMLECFYANENERLAMNKQEKQWFVATLQGESIRKQVNLPCTLTKRAAHIFLQLPSNTGLTVKQAIIYSALLATNMDEDFAELIAQRIYMYSHLDYWIHTLTILYKKGLDTLPLYEVIDYINDQVIEKKRNINFKTKKISNLYNDIEEWHYQILLKKNYDSQKVSTYLPSPIKEFQIEKENRVYRIVHIKNTKTLYIEGQQMKNCVVTYNNLCIQNICSIFSLRYSVNFEKFQSIVTIEVRENKIVQIRGPKNRPCFPNEKEIIQIWSNENDLQIAC